MEVIDRINRTGQKGLNADIGEAEEKAQPALDEAKAILREAGVPEQSIETELYPSVATTDIADKILYVAKRDNFDTVVLGRESWSWLKETVRHNHARNPIMSYQPKISQEAKARGDHRKWLEDHGRRRSELREAVAMLAKVQGAVLEQEAALEKEAAELHSHELELQEYDLIGTAPCAPDPEKQLAAHAEFARKHEQVREVHERTKNQHVNIVEEVTKLLKMYQSAK